MLDVALLSPDTFEKDNAFVSNMARPRKVPLAGKPITFDNCNITQYQGMRDKILINDNVAHAQNEADNVPQTPPSLGMGVEHNTGVKLPAFSSVFHKQTRLVTTHSILDV